MISHKYKFIYTRLPKTGSRSVESILSKLKGVDNTGHHTISKDITEDTKNYFKFTFVRNPWDRLISYYRWRKWGKDDCFSSKNKKFKDWVNDVVNLNLDELTNTEGRLSNGPVRAIDQQYNSLKDGGTLCVDFIGKFENLQEDFDFICDKIKIPQQKLPHKNKSKHNHYIEYYDDETRSIVAEKYAKDIEYFGYEFGG